MTGKHSTRARPGRATTALAIGGAGVATATIVVVILAALGLGSSSGIPQAHGATGHSGPARAPKAPHQATATSRPGTVPRHADPLTTAAVSYLSGRAGTVIATVYDIKTGQTWTLGHGPPQAEASIVKVDILETVLARHSVTRLSAGDRELAARMIEDSDNAAATRLWDSVGRASGIRTYNAAAGLTHTTPSACVSCPGFPWPGWGLSTTLPTDQITLLRRLVEPNALLTSAARSYALSLMENVAPAQRWGVCAGVPAQATVALKNGWLPLNDAGTDWQINSVGWISGRGRDYLMAVLTTGNPDERYGIDTISQLATMVWANLG